MIDFLAGLIVGLLICAFAGRVLTVLERRREAWLGSRDWAFKQFEITLIYDCPDGHAVSGELCDTSGMWVCLARLRYAEEMEAPLYDIELGIDEYLPLDDEGLWIEVEVQNECGHGCKIYEHNRTGRRALAHNSAYGCKQSFHMTPKEN